VTEKIPVTVIVATKNEKLNIRKCLSALTPASRVVVADSNSADGTAEIARSMGVEVVQFTYQGGYPKKRQWALETVGISTPWVLLLDADEVVPEALWDEIGRAIAGPGPWAGYLVTKGFHFLGKGFKFGGFSHSTVLLFRTGVARFEHVLDEPADAPDMEIHERVIVDGPIGRLRTALVHEDLKGLEAYLARHNAYSTWEARVRRRYLETRSFGPQAVKPRLFGDTQQRRRFLKLLAARVPCEPLLWFLYHYVARLGFLEGRAGLIACRIRSQYISQVRAKMYELSDVGTRSR
jgi:glycosyltransferase involved in cell wall biosynthesis